MKNLILLLLCFISYEIIGQDYVTDEIYVKLKSHALVKTNTNTGTIKLAEFENIVNINNALKHEIKQVKAPFYFSKSNELKDILRLKISSENKINSLLNDLNNDPNVEYVERIPIMRKSFSPNDLGANSSTSQWALHKIQAQNAWDITTGNSSIIVAVVDDAVQTTHPDLHGKCLQGWDVADNDNNPNPTSTCHSHGTHVAGIVGASTNNNDGVASIGFNVTILPVKATFDIDQSCRAINRGYTGVIWAADNGADIINMSWGGGGYSQTGQDIMNYAASKGIILVAAAGNDNSNTPSYPAAYKNVISVAATDINDYKADFGSGYASNYGSWVDISAPGKSIKSTVPFNNYALYQGTSMASPLVAGLCGLVWSADLSQSPQVVINCILNTADNVYGQNADYTGQLGSGRINAYQAVLCASPNPICESNKTYTAPISGFLDQEVSDWIEGKTNNIIQVGANVTYDAGDYVRLKPGFKALEGSRFHAFIDGCMGNAKTNISERTSLQKDKTNSVELSVADNFDIEIVPNPVYNKSTITYELTKSSSVSIYIYDTRGKTVTTLVKNQPQSRGLHQVEFNADNLPTGIYYLRLHANKMMATKKLMITK